VDFGRNSVERALQDRDAHRSKLKNLISLTAVRVVLMLLLLIAALAVSFVLGAIRGIVDSAPELKPDSIAPMGFATSVYDATGNQVETLVMAGSNREEATYEELPKNLINAFVAIEDERFWQHNGVDTRSIMRAVVGVIRGTSSSGGGSTITQQLIKNNLFNGGREKSFGEKLTRKIQEQYLAMKLERIMSKEVILTNYLNTINLGSNALGVKVASRRYFNKEVKDLTLSECTVLAGITQNPSRLNPITGRQANEEKRKVILRYMLRQGYITKEEQEAALADNVYDRIENADLVSKEKATHTYSYFTDELVSQVQQDLKDKFGYTDTQAHNLLYSGGLSIYTTQDPALQAIVDGEINNPANYAVTKYALEYRLSVKRANGEVQNYSERNVLANKGKDFDGLYRTDAEAKADLTRPSLIVTHTMIGYGCPALQGSEESHGAPLGADNVRAMKENLGLPAEKDFFVDADVYAYAKEVLQKGEQAEAEWNAAWAAYEKAYPELADELLKRLSGKLDLAFMDEPGFWSFADKANATRNLSGEV